MVSDQVRLGQDRSGQVIFLLTTSHSVSPSWPRVPNFDSWPYLKFGENFGIFNDTSALRCGRGCHVQGHSFCPCCVYVPTDVWDFCFVLVCPLNMIHM
jgi:hypothetical protein